MRKYGIIAILIMTMTIVAFGGGAWFSRVVVSDNFALSGVDTSIRVSSIQGIKFPAETLYYYVSSRQGVSIKVEFIPITLSNIELAPITIGIKDSSRVDSTFTYLMTELPISVFRGRYRLTTIKQDTASATRTGNVGLWYIYQEGI